MLQKDRYCRRMGGSSNQARERNGEQKLAQAPHPRSRPGGQEEREVPGVARPRRRWHSGPDLPFRMASPASPRAGCGKQGARAAPRPLPANPT